LAWGSTTTPCTTQGSLGLIRRSLGGTTRANDVQLLGHREEGTLAALIRDERSVMGAAGAFEPPDPATLFPVGLMRQSSLAFLVEHANKAQVISEAHDELVPPIGNGECLLQQATVGSP